MSSDTSATGEIPALEPQADPEAPAARQGSGFAALAPGPAHEPAAREPAAREPATREPAVDIPSRQGRELTILAAAGIGISILIMVAVSLVRGGWMLPPVVMPAAGRRGR